MTDQVLHASTVIGTSPTRWNPNIQLWEASCVCGTRISSGQRDEPAKWLEIHISHVELNGTDR